MPIKKVVKQCKRIKDPNGAVGGDRGVTEAPRD